MNELTREEYEFIKFYLNATTNRNPDGIFILKHYGLRDGKRIIHSLVKKQILEWNEEDSKMGIYAPISRGENFDSSIKTFKKIVLC